MKEKGGYYCYLLCLLVLWAVLDWLFFRMGIAYDVPEWDDKLYRSDLPLHLRDAIAGADYSLNNLVFRLCSKLTVYGTIGYRIFIICAVVYLATIVTATPMVVVFLFREISNLFLQDIEKPARNSIRVISVISIFIISLVIPDVFNHYYRGAVQINVWQNPTYFTMRLFATVAIAYFLRIDSKYMTEKASELTERDYVLFGLFFFLANFAKPNFTMAFGPMLVIVLFVDFLKVRTKDAFLRVFKFGVCAVPTLFLLLWQFTMIAETELNEDNKAVVMPFVSYMVETSHPVLKMVCFIVLPIVLFAFSYKSIQKMKKAYLRILLYWILQWLVYILMAELGTHFEDGNFSWGSIHANFLLYATLIFAFACEVKRRITEENVAVLEKKERVIFYIKNAWPAVLIAYQTIFGLIYFGRILRGDWFFF